MILKGIKNQKVEIRVLGEKKELLTLQDSDWLKLCIDVSSEAENWQTVDESLTVAEFKELVNWFRDLSLNKKVEYTNLLFTEPNLEFDLLESSENYKIIKIVFSAESRLKFSAEDKDYFMEFKFSNDELVNIANGLDSELTIKK